VVSRFLCTTALEETWRDDEPVLFLGEWCRRFSRKDRWSTMDAEVLPYHWDDRARLYADYLYLQEFHERLLREIAANLNQMHDVDHGLRYWRILVGPWLGYFVQMLFDRWACIHDAIGTYELSGTVVLFGHDETLIPNDMAEFPSFFVGDEWNHHIYGAILQQFTGVPCSRRPARVVQGTSALATPAVWTQRAYQTAARLYSSVSSALSREHDAFFLSTYLPLLDELRVQRRLGQVPQHWHSAPAVRVGVDGTKRRWVVSGESRSEFEICTRALIPKQMPALYIEGYNKLVDQAAELPWPGQPKVIWTCNSHGLDDVFKVWAAEKVERGVPLVIGQHGGHYGVGRWSFTEDHDIAISDTYLSWGWSDRQHNNVRPLGQLKAKRPLKVRHAAQSRALLVICTVPRFSYWMYSASVSRQWLDYFNGLCGFVGSLPRPVRNALIVRLYRQDFGWDQVSRWRDRFPDLDLDQGASNIDDLISHSRLYISTYNATTFLESFTMNVPTVIYWNPFHWELRASAEPYFTDLERVGIFHATPESAAKHVAAIWDNIEAWWSSPAVREVLGRFKQRYCHLPADIVGCVSDAIRESIIGANETSGQ
jgi:putative transferase (TIGR04331 family)